MRKTLLILAVLAVSGCSSDQQNIEAWMAQEASGMKGHVKPLPEIVPFPVVEYDQGALLDPFNPVKLEPDKKSGFGGLRPDMNRRREPLEAFPLESLHMVGVLMKKGETHAIVKADSSLYQVKVGNYMGQNFGVITKITGTEVFLKELVEDMNGEWTERTTSLQLQEAKQ